MSRSYQCPLPLDLRYLYRPLNPSLPFQTQSLPICHPSLPNICHYVPEENGKKYAVWKDNKAVTEFEYDECGSLESGLLAAKKDGKWGYIDESGKTVIPFEYDVSWKHYASPYPDTDMGEYCYAATEGYVPLVKDGKWEMRNTENKIVIPSGTFEEIQIGRAHV